LNRDHGRGRPDDAGRGDHGDGARGNGPGPREDAGAREGDYQGSTGWADSADEDRPAADGKDDGAGDLTGDGTRRRGDRRKDPAPAGQGDYAGGPVKPAYDGGAGTRPPRPAGETKPALASAPAPEADPVAPVEDTAPPPLESSAAEPADSPEPTAEPVAPAA
jgi:hypothetical protein